MTTSASSAATAHDTSPIAGAVLPIRRAEELLATLPGVISVRIIAGSNGAVDEIHVLTTTEVAPKQTVRNVESALIAHLGMRVSHKKISIATSNEAAPQTAPPAPAVPPAPADSVVAAVIGKRRVYFEDVEVRRSRSKGVACRVTLRKGGQTYIGEAEGLENERLRIELAARAAVAAICLAENEERGLAVEGCKAIEAFDRNFVLVGVSARVGRESMLLTGSAEIRESPETAAVLAVLDATNRWIDLAR